MPSRYSRGGCESNDDAFDSSGVQVQEESARPARAGRRPRADAIGALWGEALAGGDEPGGDRSSARDHASDEDESLLSQLAAAIGPVRGAQASLSTLTFKS